MSDEPSQRRVQTPNIYFSVNWHQTFSAVLLAMLLWGSVIVAVILTDSGLTG